MTSQLDKWAEELPTRNVVREFLEWCDEQQIELASWLPGGNRLRPLTEERERMLDRYFGIDAMQLERERMALLEKHRG